MSSSTRGKTPWTRLLILLGLALALGWMWHSPVLWPLKLTVVMFHELGHALATWATGGQVTEISLAANEGGLTWSSGGIRFIILNAGYLGSLLFGMLILASTKVYGGARAVSLGIGGLFLGTAIVLMPWFSFGFGFAIIAGLAFFGVGLFVPASIRRWILRVVGVFSVLYALMDVYSDVISRALDWGARSDAVMLAELTGVPALVWGGAWGVAGVILLVLTRRWLV